VKPVVVAFSRTVPPLATKPPLTYVKSRPTAKLPLGNVVVPFWNSTLAVDVAFVSTKAQVPPTPLNVMLYAEEPFNFTDWAETPVNRNVELLCVNVALFAKEPATVSICAAGPVTVPLLMMRLRELVAAAEKVQPPLELLKFRS